MAGSSTLEDATLDARRRVREASEERAVKSILSSWMSQASARPKAQGQDAATAVAATNDYDEDDDFTIDNEDGGLGYEPPEDLSNGGVERQHLKGNEKLRRQLLGKHARSAVFTASKPSLRSTKEKSEAEDDAPGRTGVVSSSKKRNGHQHQSNRGHVSVAADTNSVKAPKRKATSYLDEMLAKRGKKSTHQRAEQNDG